MINISVKCFGVSISECEFLGEGCEGKVYLTPDGKALKIFKNKKKCKSEYNLLKKVEQSSYFPKVVDVKGNCMLREFVRGISLKEYLDNNKLSRRLAANLIYLIEEFQSIGFTRLDIAARHIFVQDNEDIKVIDPRKSFTKKVSFPRILMSDLEKANSLENFIGILIELRPNLAKKWIKEINKL